MHRASTGGCWPDQTGGRASCLEPAQYIDDAGTQPTGCQHCPLRLNAIAWQGLATWLMGSIIMKAVQCVGGEFEQESEVKMQAL